MPAFIHHLRTRTPAHAYTRAETRDRIKGWLQDRKAQRLVHSIYARSGIDTRHSVCPDFGRSESATLYQTNVNGQLEVPTTGARNQIYSRESVPLAVELGRDLLDSSAGQFTARDITHVIFASCTGFANPGPDYHLIRQLGLASTVERYTLGFMGCYAAFPALRMAAHLCEAQTDAVVLVMCLELCTLHLQLDARPDTILANSLFADGAAAALVSAHMPADNRGSFELTGFASDLVPSSEAEMAWDIGDHGFNIVLSSYVPDIIGTNLHALLSGIVQRHGMTLSDIQRWAVHPGGRAILDRVETSLHLPPDALQASRTILKNYGNMSSPTVLFVLEELLSHPTSTATPVTALAFGPGLTVEVALLQQRAPSAPVLS